MHLLPKFNHFINLIHIQNKKMHQYAIQNNIQHIIVNNYQILLNMKMEKKSKNQIPLLYQMLLNG